MKTVALFMDMLNKLSGCIGICHVYDSGSSDDFGFMIIFVVGAIPIGAS